MSLTQTVQNVLEAYNAIEDIIARADEAAARMEQLEQRTASLVDRLDRAADASKAGAPMTLTDALLAGAVGALAGAAAAAVAVYFLP